MEVTIVARSRVRGSGITASTSLSSAIDRSVAKLPFFQAILMMQTAEDRSLEGSALQQIMPADADRNSIHAARTDRCKRFVGTGLSPADSGM